MLSSGSVGLGQRHADEEHQLDAHVRTDTDAIGAAMSDILAELRTAILRGEYAPRQRLIETELTERYATSRFVLRNALTRLAGEGLVEFQPNRGARVREISVDEAIELTEIRRAERAMRAHLTSVIDMLGRFAAAADNGAHTDS
jgi:DNA-binding FadR family transcriptional regulator